MLALATEGEAIISDAGGLSGVVIIIASVILYVQNHRQSKKVDTVQTTLTTNNGGSHVKDQLDRIEEQVEILSTRLNLSDRRSNRIENALYSHLRWANDKEDNNGQDQERR